MEHQVTVGGAQTYSLPEPFFVLATQNPIEQEGTYPLPEAQLDRFMFMIHDAVPVARGGARDPATHDRRRATWPSSKKVLDAGASCGELQAAGALGPRRGPRARLRARADARDARALERAPAVPEASGSRGARARARASSSCSAPRRTRRSRAGAHVSVEDVKAVAHPVLQPPHRDELLGQLPRA